MNSQAARKVAAASVEYVAAQLALNRHLETRPAPDAQDAARAAWRQDDHRLYARALAAWDELARLAGPWLTTR